MLRSTYDDERNVVTTDEHIREVWAAIEEHFKTYFDRFLASCQPSTSPESIARTLGTKFKVRVVGVPNRGPALEKAFREAMGAYEREALGYRNFFDRETLDEYEEINAIEFKRALQKRSNCHVVYKCVHSQFEEMHEWQRKFSARDPRELLAVFHELYRTATDYIGSTKCDRYARFDRWQQMKLDWFDDDENLRAEGVVGTGIKSTVIYHLNPALFPLCDTDALFALYFLSGKNSFGLVSDTNEFTMINDLKSDPTLINRIDRNYWYPYPVFSLYQLRLYRLLECACSGHNIALDPNYRYVYCSAFAKHIVQTPPESELVEAMRPVKESVW